MSSLQRRRVLLSRPRVPFAYITARSSDTDLTTYTYAATSLGPEHPDRHLIIPTVSRGAGSQTLSTLTVGGVSMSIAANSRNTSGGISDISIGVLKFPTGSTADIVATYSGGMTRNAIAVYWALGINTTPHDTQTSTSADPSVNLNFPARGFAIGAAYSQASTTATWTGLAEDSESVVEAAATFSTASLRTFNPQSSLAIQCTWASDSSNAAAFASFGY